MGASNSSSKNIKFYSLKGKVSAEETPNFALTEKVGEKWAITGNFDTMTGYLVSAEIKEKEFQGAKFNVFVLEINDDSETSKVEMTHNSITHSLINSLASDCNKLDEYSFTLRKKQTKGKDGKMYWNGACYINQKGRTESLKWSIDPQSAPRKEPVMVNGTQFVQNGKPVWDDTKVKAFWEDVFRTKIISVLGNPTPRAVPTAPAASSATNLPSAIDANDLPPVADDNDGLPF